MSNTSPQCLTPCRPASPSASSLLMRDGDSPPSPRQPDGHRVAIIMINQNQYMPMITHLVNIIHHGGHQDQ